jgi:hypothetical protein
MRALTAARRAGPLILVMACAFVLAGCVKLDVDLTIATDDTASGTLVVAVDKAVLELTHQDADALYQQLAASFTTSGLPNGAEATPEKYQSGNFVGAKVTVKKLPIADLATLGAGVAPTGTNTFSLTRTGDTYQFDATLDLTITGDTSGISVPDQLANDAELRVQLTFPGDVTDTNGTKDGRTATWKPTFGKSTELTATASATPTGDAGGSSDDVSYTWLIVLAIVGTLALVGAAMALLLARRRELAHAAALEPTSPGPGPGPPPPLSSLTRPAARPPASPLPPPRSPLPPPPPPSD